MHPKLYFFLLLIFSCLHTMGQKYTILEEKYKDTIAGHQTIFAKKKMIIQGAVNRGVDMLHTNNYVVEYDFRDGVFIRNKLRPIVHTPIAFKINNINSLAYDVSITAKDSILAYSFVDDISKWVDKVDSVNIKSNSKEDKSNHASVIKASDIIGKKKNRKIDSISLNKVLESVNNIPKIETLTKELKHKNMELSRFQDSLTHYNSLLEYDSIKTTSDSSHKLDTSIKIKTQTNISFFNTALTKQKLAIEKIEDSIMKLKNIQENGLRKFAEDNHKFTNTFYDISSARSSIRRTLAYYQKTVSLCQDLHLTLANYVSNHQNNMDAIRTYITEHAQDSIDLFYSKLEELKVLYSIISDNPALDTILTRNGKEKLYEQVNNMKQIAENMSKQFEGLDFNKIIIYITQNISQLADSSNYYIISYPIQPQNDVVIFDVDIKKKSTSSEGTSKNLKFRYEEFTRGGMRLDLGVGLAGSIFPNIKSYDIHRGDSNSKIYQKNKNTYVSTVIGLATLGFRSASNYMFGLSAGMGVNANDAKIELSNFFVGPSLTMGRYNRVTIAGGCALQRLDVLKNSYKENDIIASSFEIKDVTTPQTKLGFFLSVSYNLTKGIKDNMKLLSFK